MINKYILIFSLFWFTSVNAEELTVELKNGSEIIIEKIPAKGKKLLLWLPSEAGIPENVYQQARAISEQKDVEVWISKLLESYFLPVAASSIPEIPESDVAELIEKVRQLSGKQVYLVGSGRSTIPILSAARIWQQKYQQDTPFPGVVFISPKFFVETPQPGEEAKIIPIALSSNLPIHIIQPENSPWRWKMDKTVAALEKSGSDVSTQVVRNARDRFYYRPDATTIEKETAEQLPVYISRGLAFLHFSNRKIRQPVKDSVSEVKLASSKKQRALNPYKGNLDKPDIVLNDLDESPFNIQSMRGKVMLVNFWASWCPPCVHEMPSMETLYQQYKKQGFEILAVNMAEEKPVIEEFLKSKVDISFKVVQDKDGDTLKAWSVFAFPTSYLLDRTGKVRYALFGAVDWTDQEIIDVISDLINE